MKSETPRTDAELKLEAFFDGAGIVETVLVEFAEQLETELADKDKQLAEARAEIERKDKLIEQLKLALKTLRKYPHTYKMTGRSSIVVDKDIEQCNAALAAERGE